MSDQNNNKPYDDFFSANNANQSDQQREEKNDNSTGQDAESKPSYYYSYGPMSGEQSSGQQGTYPHTQARPYSHRQPQEQPQSLPYAQSVEQHAQHSGAAPYMQQGEQRQLRPFQPGGASGKGGWQGKKEKRGSSFKSMFLSFLAGVLVVGGLMYTADVQNWFSPDANASLVETQGSGSGSGTEAPPSSNGGTTTAVAGIQDRPDNISELFKSASPAVVKIETYTKMQNRSNGRSLFDDPFFRQFFGDGGAQQEQQPENDGGGMVQSGIGTGFFFDEEGYILTNQHVVGTADQIKVTVQGYEEPFIAEPLGMSYELDLAVLKVKGGEKFPTLSLGDSDHINIGDWVVAIGNPHGFDHTITVGVLSAKERPIDIPDQQGDRHYKHLLQTDASINPGNSGGPLLNMNGEVVGINTAVSAQAQGIGFAIPTSTVQAVLEDLKNNKEPAVPFIGADLAEVTEEIAQQLELDKAEGSLVVGVYLKTPAYFAGLKQYDVIVGINGESYPKRDDLIDAIQTKEVGETITMNIIRHGEKMDIQLEVGDKKKFGQ
ncbi:S1C family serine protease [Paenibacillus chungangensis]|uniref:S1C family serine protease n=1 Tax=Paenibacillus chungangensis TaxID=696535 RepID=A0ABW3HVP2_9BACL